MTLLPKETKGGTSTLSAPFTIDGKPLAVDAKVLAKMLGISVRTVRSMDCAGKLPRPVKLNGRSVRWPVVEIEAWLAAGAPDRNQWEAIRRSGVG